MIGIGCLPPERSEAAWRLKAAKRMDNQTRAARMGHCCVEVAVAGPVPAALWELRVETVARILARVWADGEEQGAGLTDAELTGITRPAQRD